jgi:hypothetical protein
MSDAAEGVVAQDLVIFYPSFYQVSLLSKIMCYSTL